MGFVGFDLERFPIKEKLEPRKTRKRRPKIHCKCSEWYESGTYDKHIRASTHSAHTNDHGFRVDIHGKVTPL